jgi:hypothetical protein
LRINESLASAGPTTTDLFDSFDTLSEFHGGEIGLSGQFRYNRLFLDLLVKLAMGNTSSLVTIDGATTSTVADTPPATITGGLLAQQSNIGRYRQNGFAIIPEFGVTLGCDITSRLRATFGYTFIYWSKVARPGDQISRDLNLSQLPPGPLVGAARPEFKFAATDYWAQGMNFGLEYQF